MMSSISCSSGKSKHVIGCFDELYNIWTPSKMLVLKSRCTQFFWRRIIEHKSHTTICFPSLFSRNLSVPRSPLVYSFVSSQSLRVVFPLSLWTNCVNNLIWAAAEKQQKIESKMLYSHNFVFCDNMVLCFQ